MAGSNAGARTASIDIERGAVVFDPDRLVPFSAYRGVAVRMEGAREPGRVRVYLDLLHSDRDLTVRLGTAEDPERAAADWQKWGRLLKLPLLVTAPDGSVSAPLASLGQLSVFPPSARRRPAHFRARRPRFLVRRKVGSRSGLAVCLRGREIIARS